MSEVELVKDLNARCMCAPHCNDPSSCDMCEKVSHCIHCDAADTIDRLVKEVERLNLSLAACGVGAMANTEASKQQRINKDHPYWCASVGDVYAAVDREMAHRTRAESAEAQVAALTKALEQIANFEPDERAWSVLIARKALEEASR